MRKRGHCITRLSGSWTDLNSGGNLTTLLFFSSTLNPQAAINKTVKLIDAERWKGINEQSYADKFKIIYKKS